MRLKTAQNHVNELFNCYEINKERKKAKKPKAAQIRRAYGLPKTHNSFQRLPKFEPITDTMNTLYHGIGKLLNFTTS